MLEALLRVTGNHVQSRQPSKYSTSLPLPIACRQHNSDGDDGHGSDNVDDDDEDDDDDKDDGHFDVYCLGIQKQSELQEKKNKTKSPRHLDILNCDWVPPGYSPQVFSISNCLRRMQMEGPHPKALHTSKFKSTQ